MTACGLVADPQTGQNKRPACGLARNSCKFQASQPAVSRNSGKTDRTVYFGSCQQAITAFRAEFGIGIINLLTAFWTIHRTLLK